jgi:predicted ATPase
MYLLCLLVAVLDRDPEEPAPILIEEPERGLHPKAILELTHFFREHATLQQPIWLTTHNEALVRGLESGELWLVDKVDGKTQMKKVEWDDMPLPLDQAWLSNALSGGLPW